MKRKLFCILTICFSLMLCSCGSFDMLAYKDAALDLTEDLESELTAMVKAATIECAYLIPKVEAGERDASIDAEILEVVYKMGIDQEHIEAKHDAVKQKYTEFMKLKIGKDEEAKIIQKRITELYEKDCIIYNYVYSENTIASDFTFYLNDVINSSLSLCEKLHSYCEY